MLSGYTRTRYSRDISFIAGRAVSRPRGFVNRPIRYTEKGLK